jgi:Ca-activated chloride channel family protein
VSNTDNSTPVNRSPDRRAARHLGGRSRRFSAMVLLACATLGALSAASVLVLKGCAAQMNTPPTAATPVGGGGAPIGTAGGASEPWSGTPTASPASSDTALLQMAPQTILPSVAPDSPAKARQRTLAGMATEGQIEAAPARSAAPAAPQSPASIPPSDAGAPNMATSRTIGGRTEDFARSPRYGGIERPGAPANQNAGERGAPARVMPLRLPDVPGQRPALNEEVWVIQRYRAEQPAAKPGVELPGSGCMIVAPPTPNAGEQRTIPVPLKHTAVTADISGSLSSVTVSQQFHNPFSEKIEAVYVFPLPESAAINDFVMTIGDRTIRGIIRDRDEARQIYEAAKAQGRHAALLEQDRPNIFTQRVANIEPGRQIDVAITYFHTLAYVDNAYEFVFPMVVGPRYNPDATYTGIGATTLGKSGTSGQPTEVTYLPPETRSGHDISVRVRLDMGVQLESLQSRSHAIDTKMFGAPGRAEVTLSSSDAIPNRDFVLRIAVAGDTMRSSLHVQPDADQSQPGGTFMLTIVPPKSTSLLPRQDQEFIFVLDTSGSMNGRPLEQATTAITRSLRRLSPSDTFQIINFASSSSSLGPAPIAATPRNIERGIAYLRALRAEGGTEMLTGINAALNFPHDTRRLRTVLFLTDGYIGNEGDILTAIRARLGAARIFSFGVGSSTNRYLLDQMAKAGRGAVAHVASGDQPEAIIDAFFERVAQPAMTDLSLSSTSATISGIFPSQLPDVFVGRPVVIMGRYAGQPPATIDIHGMRAGTNVLIPVSPSLSAAGQAIATRPILRTLWARHLIADMADTSPPDVFAELPGMIKRVALEHNLVSAYTSFIAVDSLSFTGTTPPTTVPVAVPTPEGVNHDTAVGR